MERIFDLPAHPLLVHFPVVAIPLLALAGIAMAVRPSIRDRFGVAIAVVAIITVISTFVAAQSGHALSDALELPDDFIDPHRSLGETLVYFVLGLGVTIAGAVGVGRSRPNSAIDQILRGAIVGFAVLSLVWVVRTGHEGARSVWDGQLRSDDAAATTEVDTADQSAPTTTEAESEETTTTEAEPVEETTTTTEAEPDETTTTADAGEIDGQALYEANCARCHSSDGSGGRGPNLIGLATEKRDSAIGIVTDGSSGMPSFGARLSEAEIAAIVDHLYTFS